jgi:hypothetical protein
MKTWTIIIGEAEDFDSSEDLQKFVEEQEHEPGMWARLGMASFDARPCLRAWLFHR